MIKTELTIQDFKKFFDEHMLGQVSLPNKPNVDPAGGSLVSADISLTINLTELYKYITKWRVTKQDIQIKDIVAVIVYGSSVRYPDAGYYEETIEYKKYIFFGQVIRKKLKTPKKVTDIDILVITKKDIEDGIHIEPVYGYYTLGS